MPKRAAAHKSPDISIERPKFLLNFKKSLGIGDGRFYFQAIPDDAGIGQKTANIFFIVSGNSNGIKLMQRLSIIFPLVENSLPTESGLSPIQNNVLKMFPV